MISTLFLFNHCSKLFYKCWISFTFQPVSISVRQQSQSLVRDSFHLHKFVFVGIRNRKTNCCKKFSVLSSTAVFYVVVCFSISFELNCYPLFYVTFVFVWCVLCICMGRFVSLSILFCVVVRFILCRFSVCSVVDVFCVVYWDGLCRCPVCSVVGVSYTCFAMIKMLCAYN